MTGQLGSDAICKGVLSGECATREVAAYLLDSYSKGFHSVPTTTYVEFYHPSFKNENSIPSAPIVVVIVGICQYKASTILPLIPAPYCNGAIDIRLFK